MSKAVITKLFAIILSLWLVATLTFWMMHAVPGDPFLQERAIPEEVMRALHAYYGLDAPLPVQYAKYLKGLLSFDLGPSFKFQGRTVNDIIREGFPVSAVLGGEALLLAIFLGISAGALAACHHQKWQDRSIMLASVVGISLPSFLVASLLQFLFAMKWSFFPVARWGTWQHSILPTLSLAALPASFIARLLRSTLIEVFHQDYIWTARSKGLPPWLLFWRHAFWNAIMPVITYLGPLTASILTGSFAVEKVFGIPGLGQWFVISITNRDYTVIMGVTIFYSTLLIVSVWISELIQMWADPRLRIKDRL